MTYPIPGGLKTRYQHLLAVRNEEPTYQYFPASYNFEINLIERMGAAIRALQSMLEKCPTPDVIDALKADVVLGYRSFPVIFTDKEIVKFRKDLAKATGKGLSE